MFLVFLVNVFLVFVIYGFVVLILLKQFTFTVIWLTSILSLLVFLCRNYGFIDPFVYITIVKESGVFLVVKNHLDYTFLCVFLNYYFFFLKVVFYVVFFYIFLVFFFFIFFFFFFFFNFFFFFFLFFFIFFFF